MPKGDENIQFGPDDLLAPNEPQRFSADEMVRCEECLRANPPTRASCLYCAAALPEGKSFANLRAPLLRPIEDSTPGYNNILLPKLPGISAAVRIEEAAILLKLSPADLQRIIALNMPLPLARAATREEAKLVKSKLEGLGIETMVVADAELGLKDNAAIHIRAVDMNERGLTLRQIGGGEGTQVLWQEIALLVSGRLIAKKVESSERKGKRGETEIVEATELFADELVLDIYLEGRAESFRITANNFDFSCLPNKGLVAAENFSTLLKSFRKQASEASYDEIYPSVRQLLDPIWPSGQHTGSRGWRRERPGKYNVEAVTETSNANQFTRYSRLHHLLLKQAQLGGPGGDESQRS